MKPLKIRNYGSIPHLSNSNLSIGDYYLPLGQEKILTEKCRNNDTILVFEKYDGSNVGIAKINNKIYVLNRAGYEAKTSPYKQHHLFHDWVQERESIFNEILSNNERITGEWLIQANGIIYEIEKDPIVFFDYFIGTERIIYDEFLERLQPYNLNLSRLLHRGGPVKVESLMGILNQRTSGIKSIELPEGLVYRVERNNKVDFLAKWVREGFTSNKYFDKSDINPTWNIII